MTLILIVFLIIRRKQEEDLLHIKRQIQEIDERRDEHIRIMKENFEKNRAIDLERRKRPRYMEMSLFPDLRHDVSYLSTRGEEQR